MVEQAECTNKKLAKAFVERVGLLDPDQMEPLLAEDFVFKSMFRSTGLPLAARIDRAQFLAFLRDARAFFPSLCPHSVTSVICEREHAVVESESRATFDDQRIYSNCYSFHIIIYNEKIVEVKEYTDFLHTKQVVFRT